MSRAIWHFAVVAPELADRVLAASGSDRELMLAEAGRATPRRVATYLAVLDGWDGVYLLTERFPQWFPELRTLWSDLFERGVVRICGDELNSFETPSRIESLMESLGSNPGDGYAELVLSGLNLVTSFAAATKCPGVILWRPVGMTIDDQEFRSGAG